MHTYPEYTFTSYGKNKPTDHTAKIGAALFGFVSNGFLIGIALLAARDRYLFS